MEKARIFFPKVLLFLVAAATMLMACTPRAQDSSQPRGQLPQAGSSQATTPLVTTSREVKSDREAEWEQVISAARKEGKVVWATDYAGDIRTAMSQAFKAKYGLELEFIFHSRSAELQTKMLAERRAGLYTADIYTGGLPSPYLVLVPQGVLDPLDKVLVLPQVTDTKVWWENKIPWVDPDHYMLGFIAYQMVSLFVNSDLVNPQELKSYRDLLQPKWKGKITMNDPTTFGAGNSWFTAMTQGLMDVAYLRDLARQEPVILRDARLQVEWLVRGKYPIGLAVKPELATEFKRAGAPIEPINPAEGVVLTAGNGNIALVDKAPHPNAAKLFINWFLTKEGQEIFSRASGFQSARADVPTDFLDPISVRQSGAKFFSAFELKYHVQKEPNIKIAQEMYKQFLQ